MKLTENKIEEFVKSLTGIRVVTCGEDLKDSYLTEAVAKIQDGNLILSYRDGDNWFRAGQSYEDRTIWTRPLNQELKRLFEDAATEQLHVSQTGNEEDDYWGEGSYDVILSTPDWETRWTKMSESSKEKLIRLFSYPKLQGLTLPKNLEAMEPDSVKSLLKYATPDCKVEYPDIQLEDIRLKEKKEESSLFSFQTADGDCFYQFTIRPSPSFFEGEKEIACTITYHRNELTLSAERKVSETVDMDYLASILSGTETVGNGKYVFRLQEENYSYDRVEKKLLDFIDYHSPFEIPIPSANLVDHHDSKYLRLRKETIVPRAYKGNTFIDSVRIGREVKTIGEESFAESSIRQIEFEDGFFSFFGTRHNYPEMGKDAFRSCKNLTATKDGLIFDMPKEDERKLVLGILPDSTAARLENSGWNLKYSPVNRYWISPADDRVDADSLVLPDIHLDQDPKVRVKLDSKTWKATILVLPKQLDLRAEPENFPHLREVHYSGTKEEATHDSLHNDFHKNTKIICTDGILLVEKEPSTHQLG